MDTLGYFDHAGRPRIEIKIKFLAIIINKMLVINEARSEFVTVNPYK